jgi:hypothetical protein
MSTITVRRHDVTSEEVTDALRAGLDCLLFKTIGFAAKVRGVLRDAPDLSSSVRQRLNSGA